MKNTNQFLLDNLFLSNYFLIFFLISCVGKNEEYSKKEFNFNIQYNNFEYDSKSDIYKKLIVLPAKDSILEYKVNLRTEEKLKILETIKKNNFLSLPSDCKCNTILSEPRFFCTIKFKNDFTSKEVIFIYSSNSKENNCKEVKSFNNIRDYIVSILKKRKEIEQVQNNKFILTY
ncbi:hypothetical protein [Halpernia sp. GG3]